jgi:hypothetical protein
MHPWYLKIDQIALPDESISQIMQKLLNMNYPNGSIQILTFLWCIWKSRNDCLFNKNKKDSNPSQIHHMANALKQNLELLDVTQVPTGKSQTMPDL